MLGGMRNLDTVGEQRRRVAKAHLGDIRRLDRDIKANKTLIRHAVAVSETTVTDVYGVGPIVAAFLIGYTGDPTRFATADRYAAYNGTAPIEVSSGGKTRHRLSLRGNRKLNHAIHMAAVTQIRFDTPGRVYYDKKLTEGKTGKEALRALKRRISDAVYRRLVTDQQRAQTS
jgi:transposase